MKHPLHTLGIEAFALLLTIAAHGTPGLQAHPYGSALSFC